ncbi:MAG: polyphenol oxidase family protein [Gemmatimonadota bacterium]
MSKTSVLSTLAEGPVRGSVPRFELRAWREEYGVVAGITGRGEGAQGFDLGLASEQPTRVVMDRWRDFKAAMNPFPAFVVGRQVHGTDVRWHSSGPGWTLVEGVDGHATAAAGLLLCVTAADCVPIYLVDPVRRSVALLHSGWRGTAGRIVDQGLKLLADWCGSRAQDVVVHCGVGICGRCYEVGPDVRAACGVGDSSKAGGLLDLRAVIMDQARKSGVEKVTASPYCSSHDADRFYSHRASGGRDGRMVAYLGIAP